MKCSEIRKDARTNLAGKWGKAVLITLCYVIIESILSYISKRIGEESTLSLIVNIVILLISVPLSIGLVFAFMKLKRNEEVGAFDFLTLGFSNFTKAWRIYGAAILKLIFPIILYIISIIVIGVGFIQYVNASNMNALIDSLNNTDTLVATGSPALLLIGIAILLVSTIYGYIKSLSLTLVFNIAFDEPELTGREIANKSQELMNGNKAKIFLLSLSFIGWAILSVITFGIGFLWLMPYIQVSTICFYDNLVNKN